MGLSVAVISKSDLSGGGASKVAQVVARGLAAALPGSAHFAAGSPLGWHGIAPIAGSVGAARLHRLAHAVGRRLGLAESLPVEAVPLLRAVSRGRFGLAHVHDTTTAVSPLTLEALSRRMPVLWTLHDASPVTGGCIQPMDCTRFRAACGSCPQAGEWPINGLVDLTRLHRALRARVHASGRVALAAPSRWMAGIAESSGMVRGKVMLLPNPVDTEVFSPPGDRSALRAALGLPDDGRPVLVTVAGHVSDHRKGVANAVATVRSLADLRPHLVLVGRPDASLAASLAGVDVTAAGFVSDEAELARWYGAADAFVYCSSIDNQPLTILESMACGIPTFGFDVGGSGELVRQGENGFMVAHPAVDALSAALRLAIASGRLRDMGADARAGMMRGHSLGSVLSQHLEAYACVSEDWRATTGGRA